MPCAAKLTPVPTLIGTLLLLAATCTPAAATSPPPPTAVAWASVATGGEVRGRVERPVHAATATTAPALLPTVIYLKNLSVPRVGREPDGPILDDLRTSGHLILVLDYAKHPNAVSPDLNADVLKLRQDVVDKKLLADQPVDVNRLFIVPEGFRLRRDVEFARDGDRVLAMDVWYPSQPKEPVPLLMEITCDNANRMGSGSLLYCRDTLLEGAAIAGFATAMIDHPVKPPYKGIDDPMPQVVHRLKAAVRTARALGPELGLNGSIGAIGFSRGGPMAALLAVTGDRSELEGDGPHSDVSSRVQAAMVHGNRYDYLDLRDDDPMLARFEKAWGKLVDNETRWAEHGASHYLKDGAHVPPMFLNTSDTESPEFCDGLAKFAERLKAAGVEHVYTVDPDGRGHRVTTDPKTLAEVYRFFRTHLAPAGR